MIHLFFVTLTVLTSIFYFNDHISFPLYLIFFFLNMNQDSYSPCNSPHPPPWNSKRSPWSPKPSNLILPSDKKEVEEDPIALAKMKINSLEKWKNRPKNKSKDSVQPMNEHEGHTDTLTKENLGSLFISSNNQEKNEKLERDFAIAGSVSFLSGETLRWMNSHLPFDNSYDRTRISPSFAFQLRKIFNGLDFNNSGIVLYIISYYISYCYHYYSYILTKFFILYILFIFRRNRSR